MAQKVALDIPDGSYVNLGIGIPEMVAVFVPEGREVTSEAFADLLKDRQVVNFYIGGAYGFEPAFVDSSDKSVSFGRITLSHKLVKVVLMEQIFRGLSILHHHPYHK